MCVDSDNLGDCVEDKSDCLLYDRIGTSMIYLLPVIAKTVAVGRGSQRGPVYLDVERG